MKGHIVRGRVDGTWYLRVELERDAKGARRQRRKTVRGTKADAQRALRDLLREVESGGYSDASRLTIADVANRWLASTEHRVGSRTYTFYAAHVALHVIPAIGTVRAEALRPAHVEAALSKWAAGGRHDREKGQLSQRTVAHVFNTLRTICRWAVRTGIMLRNPVDAVEPPRVERKEMRALDATGISELLAAAGGTELELPVAVAVGTGLRRGELLGLRWSDLDLEAARHSVRRSVETVKGVTRTKPPKTSRSAHDLTSGLRRRRLQAVPRRAERESSSPRARTRG